MGRVIVVLKPDDPEDVRKLRHLTDGWRLEAALRSIGEDLRRRVRGKVHNPENQQDLLDAIWDDYWCEVGELNLEDY